jgi:hypothetical protein
MSARRRRTATVIRSAANATVPRNDYAYIRKTYGVPARRFAPVKYRSRRGKVTGTRGNYLLIKFEDENKGNRIPYHPTWEIEWLEKQHV